MPFDINDDCIRRLIEKLLKIIIIESMNLIKCDGSGNHKNQSSCKYSTIR